MRKLFSLVALSLLLNGSAMAAPPSAPTPEIWFFLRPYAEMAHGVDGQQGWQKLFIEPDAPWPPFMDHVRVVALAGNMKTVPDEVLTQAFAKLKQKHIGFAIESLALSWVGIPGKKPGCGKGVESFTDPSGNAEIARKIKAAGGELAYVTMDEPLFNSRYYKGSGECNDDIQVAAQRASAIMREYQKVFSERADRRHRAVPRDNETAELAGRIQAVARRFQTDVRQADRVSQRRHQLARRQLALAAEPATGRTLRAR